MRAGVSLGLLQRNFDADFPIVGKRRRDQTVSLGVSVETRKISILGRHPKVNCTARRTRSNISLYTTNSFDCALTLKLDF
jgi:hypothetical protein